MNSRWYLSGITRVQDWDSWFFKLNQEFRELVETFGTFGLLDASPGYDVTQTKMVKIEDYYMEDYVPSIQTVLTILSEALLWTTL